MAALGLLGAGGLDPASSFFRTPVARAVLLALGLRTIVPERRGAAADVRERVPG